MCKTVAGIFQLLLSLSLFSSGSINSKKKNLECKLLSKNNNAILAFVPGMGAGSNICMKSSLDLKIVQVGMDVFFSAGIKSGNLFRKKTNQ